MAKPYRSPFFGDHANDAAALTYIKALKCDSTNDGTGTAQANQQYYHTSNNELMIYNGTAWVVVGAQQDIWYTISSDSGSTTPNTITDTLTIAGTNGLGSSISGDTVTLTGVNAAADGSTKGVAAFTAVDFDAATGVISLEATVVKTVGTDSGDVTPGEGTSDDHEFNIVGGEGIDTAADSNGNCTITGEDATSSNKGIASFETTDFVVSSGAVALGSTVGMLFATDSGTATPGEGTAADHTVNVIGGEGVDTSADSNGNLTIAGEDATTTNKGIASFVSTYFTDSSGAISLIPAVGMAFPTDAGTGIPGEGTGANYNLTFLGGSGIDSSADSNANVTHAVDDTVVRADGSVAFTSEQTGVTPSSDAHLATKGYVDSVAEGLDVKGSCYVKTTADVTLSGEQTIDGELTSSSRVLVANQDTGTEDGIWVTSSSGWTRADDMPAASSAAGAFTFIEEGTLNKDTGWVCTNDVGSDVVGTDDLVFTKFSSAGEYVAGDGLDLSTLTFSLDLKSGTALVITSTELDLALATAGGLDQTGNELAINLDGSSLVLGASGLKINGQTTAASPYGVDTPDFIGQTIQQLDQDVTWVASGATNADWVLI